MKYKPGDLVETETEDNMNGRNGVVIIVCDSSETPYYVRVLPTKEDRARLTYFAERELKPWGGR